jgi:hypothetical protein
MQTFLPFPDFDESMRVLDPKRLGNQVYREGLTLIKGGWPHHPASKMWRGYEYALALYCIAGLNELFRRGKDYPHHRLTFEGFLSNYPDTGMPPWLGNEAFHSCHRAILLWKNPLWYGQFGWTEEPKGPDEKKRFPYIWPKGKDNA